MTKQRYWQASAFGIIAGFLVSPLPLAARKAPFESTSGLLVEEILSETTDPHRYDWRRTSLQIEGGYAFTTEANSFESGGYGVGVARSIGTSFLGRLAWRHVETKTTPSAKLLSLTPFSQAAQPSRDEFLVGVGYPILEGRSATPLSPRITDIGHALFALGAIQYNSFTLNRGTLPGMRAVEYSWVAETGLRFQAYLPQDLGISLEWTFSVPISSWDPDLHSWQRLGGNVSWAFGN
jgi:hypothetical protein